MPELEREFQAELDEARVVDGGADGAEAVGGSASTTCGKAASAEIRRAQAACAIWRGKLRMVEEVEELRAEVQAHVFPRKLELFDNGEVGVDEVGAGDRLAVGIAEFTRRRLG